MNPNAMRTARRLGLALLTAVLLAGCAATEPKTDAESAPAYSAVEDRHKDHIHRPPTPN